MADCAACGTRVDEGLTKCPQCGVDLKLPGMFHQALGWVIFFASAIPLVVGAVTVQQRDFRALGAGIAVFIAGVVMIIYGRTRSRAAPPTTRPSPAPIGAPTVPQK